MTRTEITDQVRMVAILESVNVSDTEVQNLINDGLHYIGGYYPLPGVTIADLTTSGAEPAFDESYHWLVVEWVLAQVFKREEYFDVAMYHEEKFERGVRQLIKFYTGGRS